jgi:hypothetical protein
MRAPDPTVIDLTPPDFAEGLDDWSSGDGTPDSPTYERAEHVRIAVNDPDFGTCLEMRKVEPVQRLRYMAELPVPNGGFLEIRARIKALRGPLPGARIAAWPGGLYGQAVADLPSAGPVVLIPRHDQIVELCAVIGARATAGVDLVWDGRALYAHVGLDLVGPDGGVVRVERLGVRDVTDIYAGSDSP